MQAPVLVTGAAGFVGSHLVDRLVDAGLEVAAWCRPGGRDPVAPAAPPRRPARWMAVDLLDRRAVADAIAAVRPAAVYHCAGAAHVGGSWDRACATYEANVLATHHLFEALGRSRIDARVLIPGSANVYRPSERALAEDAPLGPTSPYAISKLAQERLGARIWLEEGRPVLLARAFNHVGPRQAPSFAASSFARQIARIEARRADPVILVGNLEAQRDLTDVRDTVRAYHLLMERGTPGRVYNVCSGRARAMQDVLEALLARARVPVTVRHDPARTRPVDQPIVLGDGRRIREEVGWAPVMPLERTLADLLDHWRAAVARDAS